MSFNNANSTPFERIWVAPQTVPRTIPNASGTWTNTGAKMLPHNKLTMSQNNEIVAADYKTGNTGMLPGHLGRKSASWTLEAPIRPSGTAGTAPDMDILLAAVFGAAGVASGSTVTYNWTDLAYYFLLLRYMEYATTLTQAAYFGSIVSELSMNLGGGDFIGTFSGKSCYGMTSDSFSTEDTVGKGGLTTFPAEPVLGTLHGNNILSWGGSIQIGGGTPTEFLSGNIVITTGRDLVDGFDDPYAFACTLGRHRIMLRNFKFLDTDGAALQTVKVASVFKTTENVTIIQNFSGAGFTVTHNLKNVQFGSANINEAGSAFNVDFGDSPANVTQYGNLDDYQLVFS